MEWRVPGIGTNIRIFMRSSPNSPPAPATARANPAPTPQPYYSCHTTTRAPYRSHGHGRHAQPQDPDLRHKDTCHLDAPKVLQRLLNPTRRDAFSFLYAPPF